MIKNSLKIKNLKFKIIILASCFLLHASAPPALAQEQKNSVSVTPSIAHIDLAADGPQYELTYKNNTNYDVTLNLSVQDFTELEQGYKLSFLTGQDAKNYKYSLSSWISFENRTLYLNPKEQKKVKIFIDNNRITKGGHYASILAEIVLPQSQQQVNLKAVLSSLLFVRASTGLEIEEGKISAFEPLRDGLDHPDTYILSFNNQGNVHVVPYGLVEVYDPFGNFVAKGILNEGSLDTLPESIRRYDIKINNYQKMFVPGVYKAKISIHFGKTDKKLYREISFFSQGSFNFLKIGLGLMIVLILFIYLRKRVNNLKS